MEDIRSLIDDKLDKALALAGELQDNPELGFSEFESSSILRRYWENLDLEVPGLELRQESRGQGKDRQCVFSQNSMPL